MEWVARLFEDEGQLLKGIGWTLLGVTPVVFGMLVSGMRAAYGRYSTDADMTKYGCQINGKVAWMIQESPCLLVPAALYFLYPNEACVSSTANRILLSLFVGHYIHRTLIFPTFLKGKPTRLMMMLMAFVFCIFNGYLQAAWLTRVHVYDEAWLIDPRFIVGLLVFFTGMAINMHSDYTLIGLRKGSDKGYKIPRGGMFEFVSGANFFGEILEWTGFAIASWSFPALCFAAFTFSNTAPRGYQHHQWYLSKFEDYPKSRRAVIPFIW
ncbi:hypothetical protein PTSG_08562 [Salpingoeca rosetta]|uniref:3-oxo-5-alpha-steroid 4-dehydrogenase 1 n=1 Tax=Salpingoeca rosetta (strain ATCC 50818 / BSB-021) TaxID=946362 RepID=F2UK18_SALR5|nr:uncharacterized protein PTSG_08562 [Salpingoeca rosetta]EGD77467.1 hypothetical protein PTSG_08562 [Salpingoeca rosetta]|eukprot:XP_004990355.1 hypothetical protein PTSG_08562 [Salpingoeca rosetta]